MDQLLQNLDPNTLLLIAGVCVAVCVLGVVLVFGLQIITGVFGVVLNFSELIVDVVSGGPVTWCGCAIIVVGCLACAGIAALAASAFSTCGTPQAVNICSLIGR